MSTKSRHEGYLLIDHRESPGISDELAIASGLPVGAAKGLFETSTYTCNHCHTVVIINPLRIRERAYCSKCDHYICDGCGATLAATGICKTMNQIIEEAQEAALRSFHIQENYHG